MNEFIFREKFDEGERTARLLELHMVTEWPGTLVKRANREQERRGIDLWVKYTDGTHASIQIKSCNRISQTGNFFIETVSVVPDKPGWIYSCESDFLVYIDAVTFDAYWFQTPALREAFCERWRLLREVSVPNEGYTTKGVPVRKSQVIEALHPMVTNISDPIGEDFFDEPNSDNDDQPDTTVWGRDNFPYVVSSTGQLSF